MSTTSGGIEVTPGYVPDQINGETITWDKISRMITDAVLRVMAGAIGPREITPNSITADQLATDLSAQLGVPAGSVTLGKLASGFLLPISLGGTGAATAASARTALGVDPAVQYMHVRDERSSGTSGDSYSASWQTKTLNTEKVNHISGASLGSNRITLPTGTYRLDAIVRMFISNGAESYFKIRAYNVTKSSVVDYGNGNRKFSEDTYFNTTLRILVGEITVTEASEDFEIQIYAQGGGASQAISLGSEVYADVEIWKIG